MWLCSIYHDGVRDRGSGVGGYWAKGSGASGKGMEPRAAPPPRRYPARRDPGVATLCDTAPATPLNCVASAARSGGDAAPSWDNLSQDDARASATLTRLFSLTGGWYARTSPNRSDADNHGHGSVAERSATCD